MSASIDPRLGGNGLPQGIIQFTSGMYSARVRLSNGDTLTCLSADLERASDWRAKTVRYALQLGLIQQKPRP
ncbi:hypothetical protein [Pseudomonas oryzihabitans]|uniref:hypothetical protein n=1 Tax=Pseudomonas oryzihabitans TaxID=47885 RepID=UPI0011A2E026|nr:hypothetical protein [Pseudomonas psychrotolerans]